MFLNIDGPLFLLKINKKTQLLQNSITISYSAKCPDCYNLAINVIVSKLLIGYRTLVIIIQPNLKAQQ
uniref:Uncharacterized protein n=1 Tax=Virgibacillus oceani TaxID=1479511 RepID=A0A917HGS3_9BACI|nr:hypothetical protein GCM10011398_25050 [Virgibacillus oceani]